MKNYTTISRIILRPYALYSSVLKVYLLYFACRKEVIHLLLKTVNIFLKN